MKANCKQCGKEFEKIRSQTYCSKKCRNLWRVQDAKNKGYPYYNYKPIKHKVKKCIYCRNKFTPKKCTAKFCSSKCNNAYRYITKKDTYSEYAKNKTITQKENDKIRKAKWYKSNRYRLATLDKEHYLNNRQTYIERAAKSKQISIKNLSDGYIKGIIKDQTGISNPPQEFIEQKRLIIKLKRTINEKTNALTW